ncbi:Transcription and mRNA export factor SUS1 [Yarrowia sp. B02]|nr:Transcription and mRNA export factor SUS1 [Yarrowia sp. B02]
MTDQVRADVQEKLVQSGEYEKLSQHIQARLRDSGWYDKVSALAQEEASKQDKVELGALLAKVQPQACDLVDDDIKVETLKMIASFLDGALK